MTAQAVISSSVSASLHKTGEVHFTGIHFSSKLIG